MDQLPNEVLEKIFSYLIGYEDTLLACRFVKRRWNQIAVIYWRKSHNPVTFLTNELMNEFLTDMSPDVRFQDFSYSKFRFLHISLENVSSVKQLFLNHTTHISHLEIEEISKSILTHSEEFKAFLECFNGLINLDYFHLATMPSMEYFEIAPLRPFNNLSVLEVPSLSPIDSVVEAIIKAAPNLKRLEAKAVWSPRRPNVMLNEDLFCEVANCMNIPLVNLNVKIHIRVTSTSDVLGILCDKFLHWKNIHIKRLSLNIKVDDSTRIRYVQLHTQQLLDLQADSVTELKITGWISSFQGQLSLRKMPHLQKLDLSFHSHRQLLYPIHMNPFSNLKVVVLRAFSEPSVIFQKASLDSVRDFVLITGNPVSAVSELTRWDRVFPNLRRFLYDSTQFNGGAATIDYRYLTFMITHMQMPTLEEVVYRIKTKNQSEKAKREAGVKIPRILSGLDHLQSLEEIIEAADFASYQGHEVEERFWNSVDNDLRLPSLLHIPSLKKFTIDHPITDDLARLLLLRMKPLDLLTISPGKLSLKVFCQVIARHKSYCSFKSAYSTSKVGFSKN